MRRRIYRDPWGGGGAELLREKDGNQEIVEDGIRQESFYVARAPVFFQSRNPTLRRHALRWPSLEKGIVAGHAEQKCCAQRPERAIRNVVEKKCSFKNPGP